MHWLCRLGLLCPLNWLCPLHWLCRLLRLGALRLLATKDAANAAADTTNCLAEPLTKAADCLTYSLTDATDCLTEPLTEALTKAADSLSYAARQATQQTASVRLLWCGLLRHSLLRHSLLRYLNWLLRNYLLSALLATLCRLAAGQSTDRLAHHTLTLLAASHTAERSACQATNSLPQATLALLLWHGLLWHLGRLLRLTCCWLLSHLL